MRNKSRVVKLWLACFGKYWLLIGQWRSKSDANSSVSFVFPVELELSFKHFSVLTHNLVIMFFVSTVKTQHSNIFSQLSSCESFGEIVIIYAACARPSGALAEALVWLLMALVRLGEPEPTKPFNRLMFVLTIRASHSLSTRLPSDGLRSSRKMVP